MLTFLTSLILTVQAQDFVNLSGDWDLGEGKAALRIQHAEMDRIDVLYCKRKTLIDRQVCTDTEVHEFYYDPEVSKFVNLEKDDRWFGIQALDQNTLHYQFKGPWGADEFDGRRIR